MPLRFFNKTNDRKRSITRRLLRVLRHDEESLKDMDKDGFMNIDILVQKDIFTKETITKEEIIEVAATKPEGIESFFEYDKVKNVMKALLGHSGKVLEFLKSSSDDVIEGAGSNKKPTTMNVRLGLVL